MSIAGYISVRVQLYCVGFHCFTTCFSLHGHLQVCRIFYFHMLEGFCFAAFFFFFAFFHVVTLCMFPSVGWLKYEVLLLLLLLLLLLKHTLCRRYTVPHFIILMQS
jgi:hypothetical protein